jgi:hypothetical protein
MVDWNGLGKSLILIGVLMAVVGGAILLAGQAGVATKGLSWFGRLPGDFLIKRDHVTFYFPLATSFLLSLVLTLVLYFLTNR